MNVTLSIPDPLLGEARRIAEARGISLNQLIRDELERVTRAATPEQSVAELRRLWAESGGTSRGKRWTRDELHERARVR